MFARRFAWHVPRRQFMKHSQRWPARSRQRRFSTATAPGSAAVSGSAPVLPAIQAVKQELDLLAPRIDIDADNVDVILGPKQFYEALKQRISNAKTRIFLATLYVGSSEHELMQCIREALQKSPDLKVSILTDALRGTREDPKPSCASLLAELENSFPDRVEIRMYHTPNLTGLRKSIVPKRLNEGWGLQHMKLYGIDDDVILSGANLSNDYFTDRQDRYHIFASKTATDFFAGVHDAMCSMSFLMKAKDAKGGFELKWPSDNVCASPVDDPKAFVACSKGIFTKFISPGLPTQEATGTRTASIYPVLIIPKAVNNELPALQSILSTSSRKVASYMFTAGYFNPDPAVTSTLLQTAQTGARATVVTASPWANGFYGSKGVSGMLPAAYTLLSRRFLEKAKKIAPGAVELREWRCGTVGRPHGWTYHAKGLWLSYDSGLVADEPSSALTQSEGPSVTIIGSSNYTVRSYSLDTEVGAVVVTGDPGLRTKYQREEENLLEHSRAVTIDDLQGGERRVSPMVRVAMWIVRAIGGSL